MMDNDNVDQPVENDPKGTIYTYNTSFHLQIVHIY